MPDLQTEMQKILQAWDNQPETTAQPPKDTPMFKITTNTSRATFEAVRDEPGLTKADYVRKLKILGHNKSSVYSLMAQMVKQGHLWEDSTGHLRPNITEYSPLKCSTTMKKLAKKAGQPTPPVLRRNKVKEVPVPVGITSLVEAHAEKAKVEIAPVEHDRVQHIMDTINLSDAKRLHKALNEYFGSV